MEKEESYQEGLEAGEARGEARGLTNSRVDSIRNLMKNLGLTVDAAINALGIPSEEHQVYVSLVSQQGRLNV